jgi:hypothetical protein
VTDFAKSSSGQIYFALDSNPLKIIGTVSSSTKSGTISGYNVNSVSSSDYVSGGLNPFDSGGNNYLNIAL